MFDNRYFKSFLITTSSRCNSTFITLFRRIYFPYTSADLADPPDSRYFPPAPNPLLNLRKPMFLPLPKISIDHKRLIPLTSNYLSPFTFPLYFFIFHLKWFHWSATPGISVRSF